MSQKLEQIFFFWKHIKFAQSTVEFSNFKSNIKIPKLL